MNLQEYGVEVIEKIVASIPQIVLTLSLVVYYLGKVKTVAEKFPTEVKSTKDLLGTAFNGAKQDLSTAYKDMSESIYKSLFSMQEEIILFKKEVENNRKSMDALVIENQAYMDIIAKLISVDSELIKNGSATEITEIIKTTNKQLDKGGATDGKKL